MACTNPDSRNTPNPRTKTNSVSHGDASALGNKLCKNHRMPSGLNMFRTGNSCRLPAHDPITNRTPAIITPNVARLQSQCLFFIGF